MSERDMMYEFVLNRVYQKGRPFYVRMAGAEVILVDPARDKPLESFLDEVYESLTEERKGERVLKPEYARLSLRERELAMLRHVQSMVLEKIKTGEAGQEALSARALRDRPLLLKLGDFLEIGYGVCRQQNLLGHVTLEFLKSKGIMELSTVVSRGGQGHFYTLVLGEPSRTFPFPSGKRKLYVLDITQNQVKEFKEGDAFLEEFRAAGFREAVMLRTSRNARTKNPRVLAAEVCAYR